MKQIFIFLILLAGNIANASWFSSEPKHLTGSKNITVFYPTSKGRESASAEYLSFGELRFKNSEEGGIPIIDIHPGGSYIRLGFSDLDSKNQNIVGDYEGMVRFLGWLSPGEFYIDQIDLGTNLRTSRVSIDSLGSDFFYIKKLCVRVQYIKLVGAEKKLENRTVFLKGSTLTKKGKINLDWNQCTIEQD